MVKESKREPEEVGEIPASPASSVWALPAFGVVRTGGRDLLVLCGLLTSEGSLFAAAQAPTIVFCFTVLKAMKPADFILNT